MEGLSATVYRGLKGYWQRRSYRRLKRRRRNRPELAGCRRKGFWRIRIAPRRLKLRGVVPKKFLTRLRDSYVNFMFRIASSGGIAAASNSIPGTSMAPGKEYDEKMIIEIYKSLVRAQGLALSH